MDLYYNFLTKIIFNQRVLVLHFSIPIPMEYERQYWAISGYITCNISIFIAMCRKQEVATHIKYLHQLLIFVLILYILDLLT